MLKKATTNPKGLTIIELIIAMAVTATVVLGIGIILADSQRSWQRIYDDLNAEIITDSYAARSAFDSVVRKSSREKYLLADDGSWVEVYYYENVSSSSVDRYARFYCVSDAYSFGRLYVEYGRWDPAATEPKSPMEVQLICSNVSSCVFKGAGESVQMILVLDDGERTINVVTSAVLNNY